jgi:AcrR family transcriptional regulator
VPDSAVKPGRLGRPPSKTAGAHAAIMDAVYALLRETSVRDLTMEAIAKRAGVGKPTLYKWWPSKAALVFAMFHERLAGEPTVTKARTAEAAIRERARRLVVALNGLFGKVMAELIAEGQSDPAVLRELYEQHIAPRRAAALLDIERGKANGEIVADADADLLLEEIFGAIYYRMLLRSGRLTEEYGNRVVDQVFKGLRRRKSPN